MFNLTVVGDRHRGPPNNRGKPASSRKKRKTKTNPRAQNAHTTRSRPWWPPWPTRATSLSTRSGEVRLARGPSAPSGEVHLARRLSAPSGEVRFARGSPHARHPRTCPHARAISWSDTRRSAPRPRCAWESRPALFHRRAWESRPGVRPSPPLYDTVWRGWCQLRGTVSPTFVRLTHRALEGGWRNPRRGDKHFFHVYTGLHHDVRLARTVFSVSINPVRPSPPLQRHSGTAASSLTL
jgi:hypothetical protein